MVGKTNVYDYSFNKSLNFSTSNAITTSNITASNGLTYDFYVDGNNTWELVIKTSGTITFNKGFSADIFLVGGGKTGSKGSYDQSGSNYNAYGGKGGNGGETKYIQTTINANQAYQIVIGNNSNNTSGFNTIATSGGGCAGGKGAAVDGYDSSAGYPADSGTTSQYYAFYQQNASHFYPTVRFGAGGGGGAAEGYHSGRDGNYTVYRAYGAGGATGGGRGGETSNTTAAAGTANYGAGGGGGSTVATNASRKTNNGGAGGTGVIIMHPMDFVGW